MSGIAKLRLPTPLEVDLGFNAFGRREPDLGSIDDQIVQTSQVFSDLGIVGDKIESLTVDKLRAGSIRVDEYLQSTGFVSGSTGWKIDGNGDAEFANITLVGGTLKFGKTSLSDFTNPGWILDSSGVHIGASASTFLTYNISTGALTIGGGTISGTFTGSITGTKSTMNVFTTNDSDNTTRISISNATYGTPAQSANSFAVILGSTNTFEIRPHNGSIGSWNIYATPAASDGQLLINWASADSADFSGSPTDAVIKLNASGSSGKYNLIHLTSAGDGRPLNIAHSGTTYAPIIVSGGVVSTNFRKILKGNAATIWESDGTTPNGNLSGTAGDICLNGDSGNIYRCTGTTNWTAM